MTDVRRSATSGISIGRHRPCRPNGNQVIVVHLATLLWPERHERLRPTERCHKLNGQGIGRQHLDHGAEVTAPKPRCWEIRTEHQNIERLEPHALLTIALSARRTRKRARVPSGALTQRTLVR